MILRVGTRQSALAQTQTQAVIAQLKVLDPQLEVETVLVTTTGDRMQKPEVPVLALKGSFTKELDDALRDGRIDLAVHSFKDIPPGPMPDLSIAAVPLREDAREAWISKTGTSFAQLSPGACIGTSSVRRRALLLRQRPDLNVIPLRGNVDTRLRKLREGSFEGIVLAYAGLKRLGLQEQATEVLPLDTFLPAAAQGALALVIRTADLSASFAPWTTIFKLQHKPSYDAALCEQTCLEVLAGSCHTPIAVHALIQETRFSAHALVLDPEGREACEAHIDRPYPCNPLLVGRELAEMLITRGAERLLEA